MPLETLSEVEEIIVGHMRSVSDHRFRPCQEPIRAFFVHQTLYALASSKLLSLHNKLLSLSWWPSLFLGKQAV